MRVLREIRWFGIATAIFCVAIASCGKPRDAAKSDLGEVGYQLTADDWFRASRGNDVTALKKFIASGFPIDTKDAAGDTALHAAAAAGAKDAADFLMDRGLQINLHGAAERTPLMAAITADQTPMVRWLLRQGADPLLKDKDGYAPLMIAVREGKAGSVTELAPYDRENLDPALLVAALLGKTEVIDSLTSYGASVYAQMDDGRTPLMIAAENGHAESVKLLLDLGSSRLSTDAAGHTAVDLATAANHPDIAAIIAREPQPQELTLETPAQIATAMDRYVQKETSAPSTEKPISHTPAKPIQGAILSPAVDRSTAATNDKPDAPPSSPSASPPASAPAASSDAPRMPPIIMRHYQEREIPIQVRTVEGDTATLTVRGKTTRDVKVRAGDTIPGSHLVVIRVHRSMRSGKLNLGNPVEASVVEIKDTHTGITREWISGVSSAAHDPTALVEDAATGTRYTATPGQKFTSEDGEPFTVSEVRPNQIVIVNTATNAVKTIPLSGPRG